MANINAFTTKRAEHDKTLKLYVPIVARVHGKEHPEFLEVHALYDEMEDLIKAKETSLDEVFANLRKITNDYQVPDDVCESYEAVYVMLGDLDRAYHS
ncbi:MAG: hypothetical protein WC233_06065 [Sphaerochaeta sp.]|jgi:iron-sulfur cluster repair protein YtfE (RIC family)